MSFNLQSALDDMFKQPSRLQTMIDRAMATQRDDPDLALNLDICELVNTKKGNNPHDAVFGLLPYINGKSRIQALLALTLLDNLVKNCGHSVHYQIASREFLNDLFRRFPEYQPAMPNPVHHRILEMLQEWRTTLCRHSRYRDDLHRINDMYSLLRRKGWRFPDIETENAAVMLGPKDALKSRDELEKEDLEAMQAKLQELLRRATPRDLREANKLMKIITGYEQSSRKPDYDKEWDEELQGVEHKVTLLAEIIRNATPGNKLDDTARELLSKCTSAQLRLQKLITEQEAAGSNDDESNATESTEMARLIHLNDLIVEVVQAFKDVEQGKTPEIRGSLANYDAVGAAASQQSSNGSNNDNELIVWDDEGEGNTNNNANNQNSQLAEQSTPLSPLDDLVGLDFKESAFTSSPSMSAGSNSVAVPQTLNTPGLSVPLSGTARTTSSTSLHAKPMSNPSLPANLQQARIGKASSKEKDVFDFSDLLSAAKSASRVSASPVLSTSPGPQTVSGSTGFASTSQSRLDSSPEPPKSKDTSNSLIDFL
ncbi:ARF-binding protein [Coemansia spiralis]|uniref:ARF-binding protein n=2 Tax=Coemansia TaxID=4863 RepID=A0A9W8KWN1_9FUNG|nr:VHS domain-containing protein [Coemansia spiralis]KAJ1994428.1 ARF-binding protein [Coemansia umbellata]KAJ2624261.1 ARF-binding protein [Coemansia sp. RSA 1358]KAJ2674196.1 ARF-binding protein [Coemansia spiralis]